MKEQWCQSLAGRWGRGCAPAGLVEIRIVTALFKSNLMTSIRLKITTPLTLRPHAWVSHGNQTPVLQWDM